MSSLAVIVAIVAAKALCTPTVVPKAYAVAEINVTDPEAYKQYLEAVTPIVAQFGGKYLVRAGTVIPIEGKAPTGRVVIIEFQSLASAQLFEASPQYLKIAPLRQRASRSRLFLVEGSPLS
ncbi:MAG TPA: DUF1330 domain-containing protein [Terracidiphilus sp.]|nr:DUF1330 domain-containing protein [Terracidiphilus sp.]